MNRDFAIKRYTLGKLEKLFDGHGLRRTRTWPVAYGPPTFWRKSFLPLRAERTISAFLDRLSRVRGFGWLKYFANEWVLCFIKE